MVASMIHYHGVPLSGGRANMMVLKGRHAMVSYAHSSPVSAVAEICQSFTLDNGAFSTWKTGKPYDVEGFAEWVSLWSKHPGCDWYLIPDDIEGGEDENALRRSQFFSCVESEVWRKGVPIWHLHEPLDVLANFLNWPQPFVALGSSGDYAQIGTDKWLNRMAEAMEVVCDSDGYPWKRIHGLRMLDPTIFSHFPFSSADSTNVARNIGIDQRWHGPYAPASKEMRALIMMDRIESHASASRWAGTWGKNEELFG